MYFRTSRLLHSKEIYIQNMVTVLILIFLSNTYFILNCRLPYDGRTIWPKHVAL